MSKIIITKIFMISLSFLTFLWWPLSHWFYSDWYHRLLGFEKWDESMVKMIGTCGLLPVFILLITGLNPVRYRRNAISIVIFMCTLGFTFLYLISRNLFPVGEYLNVFICFFSGLITLIIYPWTCKE